MDSCHFADVIRAVAQRHPDRPAVLTEDVTLTYAAFRAQFEKAAARLIEDGVRPGERIGIAVTEPLDYLVLLLAVMHAGACVVPLDFRSRPDERARIVDGIAIDRVIESRRSAAPAFFPVIRIDADWWTRADAATPLVSPPRDGETPALIALTSGTTGRPRGFVETHDELYIRMMHSALARGTTENDRFFCALSLSFTGSRSLALSHLIVGSSVVLFPIIYSPAELVGGIRRFAATEIFVVPTMVRDLLALASDGETLLPGIRFFVTSGAPIDAAQKRRALALLCPTIHESYAASVGGMISMLTPADIEAHAHTVGRPVVHSLVEIVDREDRPLPVNTPGRLRYRSPGASYEIIDPDGAGFGDTVRDGWVYPGEIALIDDDGYVVIQSRESDMILRGGVNVYPAEIEAVLTAHEKVADAAVVAWPSPRLGEDIAAFVVADGSLGRDDLLGWCRQRLGPDKQPRDVFFVEALPRNLNGKVVKSDLTATLPALAG